MKSVVSSPLLVFAFRLDAFVSAVTGALQIALAGTLAAPLGLPAALLSGSGVFMLAYAAMLALLGARAHLPVVAVRAIVAGNGLWALGCVALPALGTLAPTAWGLGFLAVHAFAVTAFAVLQTLGLRRSTAVPGSIGRWVAAPGSR